MLEEWVKMMAFKSLLFAGAGLYEQSGAVGPEMSFRPSYAKI